MLPTKKGHHYSDLSLMGWIFFSGKHGWFVCFFHPKNLNGDEDEVLQVSP